MMRLFSFTVLTATAALGQGFPSSPQLVYRGFVVSGSLPSTPQMKVRLWKSATSVQSADMVCNPPVFVPVTPDSTGRFEVQLDSSCVEVIKNGADLWAELEILNLGPAGPRSAIKAVPFALTAQRSHRTIAGQGTSQISGNGVFVRATMMNYTGSWSFMGLTGYRAGKRICETETGSQSAHVCSPEEANRSALIGVTMPGMGWLMNMNGWGGGVLISNATNNAINECALHTSEGPSTAGDPGATLGLAWDTMSVGQPGGGGVTPLWCKNPMPIFCCD